MQVFGLLLLALSCSNLDFLFQKKSSNNPSLALGILGVLNANAALDQEGLSAGDATVNDVTTFAFQQPVGNMVDTQRIVQFASGHALFVSTWTSPGNTANPGLGPTFNNVSCSSCHSLDGRGKPDASLSQILFRISIPGTNSTTGGPLGVPNFGEQLNPSGINGVAGEGNVQISYVEVPGRFSDGETFSLRRPVYTVTLNSSIGAQPQNLFVSPRVTPQNFGMGLLEAIPEAAILANADPNDTNQDQISGVANLVFDAVDRRAKLGRFGWKANQPNVAQQNQGAFLGDIGITSPLFVNENCPDIQATMACGLPTNTGRGVQVPEINSASADRINFYMRTIGVPIRRNWKSSVAVQGRNNFMNIGCAKCHIPMFTTGAVPGIPEISNQVIRPFTDLLLHDMGPDLADGRTDFLANGNEWRTPPLWGIGMIQTVNGHSNLLHDGRARGFQEAILWHGGEAQTAKQNYMLLSKSDRDAVIKFLESL